MESIYKILDTIPSEMYDKLRDFIKNHWKENHVFVSSKELLDFQHFNKESDLYHFIVALNKNTNEIDALIGYIPTCQYDSSLELGDYWGAIWKRRNDIDTPEGKTLGMDLFIHYLNLPQVSSLCGISLSNDAYNWYKKLKWKMDFLHQYYIFNKTYSDFKLANNVCTADLRDASIKKEKGWTLEHIKLEKLDDDVVKAVYRPRKSMEFLRNRYLRHPIYHYDYLGLFCESDLKAILVYRVCEGNGGKIIRIVDTLGELGGYIYPSMQTILQEGEYEYADFLNYGIDKTIFTEMGFNELDFDNGNLILPNYFEPFERRNVKMTVVYKAKFPYVAFKGDADQDRPNVL